MGRRTWFRGMLVLALGAVMVAGLATISAAEGDAGGQRTHEVAVTDDGFDPALVRVARGDTVLWINATEREVELESELTLLDSGPVPPGGAFVAAFAEPGAYRLTDGVHGGWVQVGVEHLEGPEDGLLTDHLPEIPFPIGADLDHDEHPRWGVTMSRTLIQLGFVDGVTVGQANEVLARAGTSVFATMPTLGLLVVQTDDSDDLSALDAALDVLDAEPLVDTASFTGAFDEAVVPPPAVEFLLEEWGWRWEAPDEPLSGSRGTWGLAASTFPQAWNLNDAIRQHGDPRSSVAIAERGDFEDHVALSRIDRRQVCMHTNEFRQYFDWRKCWRPGASDHANHVAGIVGADHPAGVTRSATITGGTPFGELRAWPGADYGLPTFEWVLTEIASEPWGAHVRVMNSSNQRPVNAERWLARQECGPDGDQPCHPNSDPAWQRRMENEARTYLPLLDRAAELGVTIVASTGNQSEPHHEVGRDEDGRPIREPIPGWDRVEAHNLEPLALAARLWDADPSRAPEDNPVVMVEAVGGRDTGEEGERAWDQASVIAPFSNGAGTISAPGVSIVSASTSAGDRCDPASDRPSQSGRDGYCPMSGTSMAAPMVSAAVGLLTAYDPDLTIAQIRHALLEWAEPTDDGVASRLAVFRSLLSLEDAARHLVDVNDASADGNRRVEYGPGGEPLGLDLDVELEPDGAIDMRDFRRFRDAVLLLCQQGDIDDGCPESIDLDGGDDHPKRDLNLDGCVHGDDCPTEESAFPRYDFNGSGRLSLTDRVLVPLHPDGTPAAAWDQGTEMTDLEVLASQWDAGTPGAEGWGDTDLEELIDSGDLEIHGDGFARRRRRPGGTPVRRRDRRHDDRAGPPPDRGAAVDRRDGSGRP